MIKNECKKVSFYSILEKIHSNAKCINEDLTILIPTLLEL